jgi:hypothetical protein
VPVSQGESPSPGPRVRRAFALSVVTVVTLLSVVAGPSATAAQAASPRADPPRLMLSADGQRWQVRLAAGPSTARTALVPGGTTSTTFWVKNATSGSAVLAARVVDVEVSTPAFARDLTVTASQGTAVDGAGASPIRLDPSACGAVLNPASLSAGEEAPVTVALRLAESAPESSAGQSVGVTVLVSLAGLADDAGADCASSGGERSAPLRGSDGDAGAGPADGVITASGGPLAAGAASGETSARFVGVPLPEEWLPLLIGLLSLLAGGYVALGRRRPDADAEASNGADPGAASSRDMTDGTRP